MSIIILIELMTFLKKYHDIENLKFSKIQKVSFGPVIIITMHAYYSVIIIIMNYHHNLLQFFYY